MFKLLLDRLVERVRTRIAFSLSLCLLLSRQRDKQDIQVRHCCWLHKSSFTLAAGTQFQMKRERGRERDKNKNKRSRDGPKQLLSISLSSCLVWRLFVHRNVDECSMNCRKSSVENTMGLSASFCLFRPFQEEQTMSARRWTLPCREIGGSGICFK